MPSQSTLIESGGIAHAQLTLGGGMLMLGSASNDNAYGNLVKLPAAVSAASISKATCGASALMTLARDRNRLGNLRSTRHIHPRERMLAVRSVTETMRINEL
jgi:hypothetical protein